MIRISLALCALAATCAVDAATTSTTDTRPFSTITGDSTLATFTGTYDTDSSQQTNTQTGKLVNQGTTTSGAATAGSTSTITLLAGGGVGIQTLSVINGTTTIFPNSTASVSQTSSTTSSAQATNTQACNGYVEFCSRSYGNITQVAAHNAAFAVAGNVASNQKYGITQQLNDGIRMITGETHYANSTFYSCHTSCSLLNAGLYVNNLEEIATWVRAHPYDVVTILIVNSDYRTVEEYAPIIQNSGLSPYLYTPPYIPMRLGDWPTLEEMILRQERVVVFMDYNANQTSVPYILDEFRHIWETPFSPEDDNFPCTLQRPPTLTNVTEAKDEFMYLANHNLNLALSLAGTSFLIPNTAVINETNAAGLSTGMLGNMSNTCTQQWGRPPNWLLVDFYDRVDGSVFQVAAAANNVTYTETCCGVATSGADKDGNASVLWVTLAACLLALMLS